MIFEKCKLKKRLQSPHRSVEKAESLLKRYDSNLPIRLLVQLYLGVWGPLVDTSLTVIYSNVQNICSNIQEKRAACFFDELLNRNIQLTQQLIESEDFIHKYFITAKAALNSRRKEKIKMFARMLKKSTLQNTFSDTDEYEEYLQILDEMSYREFEVLQILEQYSKKHPKQVNENKLQNLSKFWDDFIRDMVEIGIPTAETESFLTRLSRTGCFRNLDQAYTGYEGGKGTLTESYFKLINFVLRHGAA